MSSTRPTGRGSETVEIPPTECPNGHALRPRTVAVAHLPCACNGAGGHRTYTCRTCDVTTHDPPHIKSSALPGD